MSLRKVCIVGFSPNSRDEAPYDDDSFEFWGMNNLHSVVEGKRWDAWFDMHDPEFIRANNPNLRTDHYAWLERLDVPVFMLEKYEQFPTSQAFPLRAIQKRMVEEWGFASDETGYFHSAFAYMMALALHQGVDEIHVYGIDMTKDNEWGFQRPNAEGWVCLARQLPALNGGKVRVVIAPDCALLKGPGLYGYAAQEFSFPRRMKQSMKRHLSALDEKVKEAEKDLQRANVNKIFQEGYRTGVRDYIVLLDEAERGVVIHDAKEKAG